MISVNDFVNTIYIPYTEKGGYIWGAYGQVHTKADQASATREQTVKWGSQWIGKRCWDCSGLIYWAFRLYGESIYHGSNTMFNQYCSEKGKLYNGQRQDNEPLKIGSAVFLYRNADDNRHHVGVYVGNGKVIEAKGTYYGVVMSDVSKWDEWGQLKGVDYSQRVVVDMNVLRIGMKSDAVKKLQLNLNAMGYDCGNADGIFGQATKAAVIRLQSSYGLDADGVVGVKTQSVIDAFFNDSTSVSCVDKELITQALEAAQNAEKQAQKAIDLLTEIKRLLTEGGDDGK